MSAISECSSLKMPTLPARTSVLSPLVLPIQTVPRCCECWYYETKSIVFPLNCGVGIYESVFYLNQDQL